MLNNKTFLITRPQQQAASLIQAINTVGGKCISCPCIEIETIKQQQSMPIEQQDMCIFTSSNAVNSLTNDELTQLPIETIAIGPATAAALEKRGITNIQQPQENYSSGGLLALTTLQDVTQKHIMIFTGENPKPLLAETLAKRAAIVTNIYCYRRIKPQYSETDLKKITSEKIDCIIVLSTETLINLCDIFKAHYEWLLSHTILVASEDAQQAAFAAGFTNVIRATNPRPDSLIRAYF